MIGNVVGSYKITDKIGEGGMGSVYRGIDVMLEREVAIKMLRPELSRQPNVVERFRSEAITLAKLNHPNIATLYSFLRQGDDYFMVMEFVRGETLDSMIRRCGAMNCEQAITLFSQALEGIEHAHTLGIIHRDIKPANMMLTETGSIKVMDFGIARVLGSDRLTKTGHLIGTVEYMSPEQVRGEETDARSDIYSLGILLYEMLTGRVPFNSTSEYELMRCHIEEAPTPPGSLVPQIPVIIEQAIMRSLAKRRESRHQTASEFRLMLMQAGTAAVTRADTAPASPASYVTRVSDSLPGAVPYENAIKATRLADETVVLIPDARPIAETRLASNAVAASAYHQPPAHANAPAQAASPLAALLGKLNWKHYAAAAAVLLALISLPFVLGGGTENAATTTARPSVGAPSPNPPPAQGAQSNPNPQAVPSGSQPNPLPNDRISSPVDSGSGKAKRAARSGQSSDAQASPQRKAPSQAQNTESRRTETSPKVAEKKSKTEKVVEAAGAVGGALKSVFGRKKRN